MSAIKEKEVTMICPVHGEFSGTERTLYLSDYERPKVMSPKCPKCMEAIKRKEKETKRQERVSIAKKILEDADIPARYIRKGLGDFYPSCPDAQIVFEKAQKYVKSFRQNPGSCLILCGNVGTGKTHLACGIAKELAIDFDIRSRFLDFAELISMITETWGKKEVSEREVLKNLTRPELLIVDELGVNFGAKHEQLLFSRLINKRYNAEKSTILISNLDIDKELKPFLGDRNVDRFREVGCDILFFTWESMRGQLGAVRDHVDFAIKQA